MKALVFHTPKHVSVDTVEDPKIEQVRDAALRVTATAICGSDLHIYNGGVPATETTRAGNGRVSIMGVYGTTYDNFPLGQWLDKGLRVQCGQATVHNFIDELMTMIVNGSLKPDDIISHHLPLDRAPDAYRIFNKKEEACTKVVLNPCA